MLRHLLNEADSEGRPWQHEWVRPPEAAALVALLESVGRPSIDLSGFTQQFSSLHTVSCSVRRQLYNCSRICATLLRMLLVTSRPNCNH